MLSQIERWYYKMAIKLGSFCSHVMLPENSTKAAMLESRQACKGAVMFFVHLPCPLLLSFYLTFINCSFMWEGVQNFYWIQDLRL